VIAKVMRIKAEDVDPKKTLAQLKVGPLELADIRDELETRLKITLPSATLEKISGAEDKYTVADKLTVAQLADAVNATPTK
jgi:acyl carrier protein